MSPQEAACFCHAVVVVGIAELGLSVLSVYNHAAELVNVERPAEASYAFLLIDDGAVVFALDGYVAIKEKGREDY
jgi:hypothetical protein